MTTPRLFYQMRLNDLCDHLSQETLKALYEIALTARDTNKPVEEAIRDYMTKGAPDNAESHDSD